MQNYVLSDVLTKVGCCFSGGYGIVFVAELLMTGMRS
jgi:hypothetical protein